MVAKLALVLNALLIFPRRTLRACLRAWEHSLREQFVKSVLHNSKEQIDGWRRELLEAMFLQKEEDTTDATHFCPLLQTLPMCHVHVRFVRIMARCCWSCAGGSGVSGITFCRKSRGILQLLQVATDTTHSISCLLLHFVPLLRFGAIPQCSTMQFATLPAVCWHAMERSTQIPAAFAAVPTSTIRKTGFESLSSFLPSTCKTKPTCEPAEGTNKSYESMATISWMGFGSCPVV